jgi:hypothetical protein
VPSSSLTNKLSLESLKGFLMEVTEEEDNIEELMTRNGW